MDVAIADATPVNTVDMDVTEPSPSKKLRVREPERPNQMIFNQHTVPSSLRNVVLAEQHEIMLNEEKAQPRQFNEKANYLPYRRILVDWMSEVGEHFGLLQQTVHAAVNHLDNILAYKNVQRDCLQLVAICCLLIAAKYEEAQEINAPTISQLLYCADNCYDKLSVTRMELTLLESMDWNVGSYTAVHFQGMYLPGGVVASSDVVRGNKIMDELRLRRYVKKYAEFFLDMALQEYEFVQCKSSALAVVTIAAARRALGVEPVYSPALQFLSKYSFTQIEGLLEHIWGVYQREFPQPIVPTKDAETPGDITAMHQ